MNKILYVIYFLLPLLHIQLIKTSGKMAAFFGNPAPNMPVLYPIREEIYTVASPCACPLGYRCPLGNDIICPDCHKAHRFHGYRDNECSNFGSLWCGIGVLNTEKELRAHLRECTHRPAPQVDFEEDMCRCDSVHTCSSTPQLSNNYLVEFSEESEELENPMYPIPGS